jgi:hypothetical protein
MEVEFCPAKQDEERPEDGKDNAGWMKGRAFPWTREQMRDEAADQRTDNSQTYCPEQRQMDVHDGLRHVPGDEADDYVPDEMKHSFSV